jgi:hypothetical protein
VSDLSGISVSNAGDVNGDGLDDLIVGANYADRLMDSTTFATSSAAKVPEVLLMIKV